MAAKNQDGGRKFLFLSTKKLSMVLKNNHTKNGAWGQSVTAQGFFYPYITPLSLTAAPLYYNMSFFPRGVDDWNSLLRIQPTLAAPAGPNAAEAIKAFKASVMAVVV